MNKTKQFRKLLASAELEFICEAHNGLSARIAEEAGFRAVWGSGLTISAQLGVRDSNEASWTQVMDVVEFMADATTVPVMLDGDTGYGNFNNVQRLVRKLEQRGVAAVCIEDKLFPKTNSFIAGERQALADIDEFCGKIKAAKDAQQDDAFSLVARVEAFIAGRGLDEALRRAEAYQAAGADAILMHSALSVPDEILAFMREWGDRCPVVIVPTKYYSTPVEVYREHGVSMVIWANHLLRSAISAMQDTARVLHETQSLAKLEQQVASVSEIFRLQGAQALEEAERRYLPESRSAPAALVLAASRGDELRELTEDKPKAMVRVGDRPLLAHIAASYRSTGIDDITVVRGYRKEVVNLPDLHYVDNDDYADTGELHSLWKGLGSRDWPNGVVVSYGDVLFRKYVLEYLREVGDELVIPVDTRWQDSVNRGRDVDYVNCSLPYSRTHYNRPVLLRKMTGDLPEGDIHGEWMGLVYISPNALPAVRAALDEMHAEPRNRKAKVPALLNRLASSGHAVRVVYTSGNWLDVDSLDDVVNAAGF
ncbi:MAG: phosphoenolpyruvate phosphomutase [Betaproteobacteria bacterium]|nr:phosphoenolpyruvate phosphomutase [Betaproteobacteria bacterium]